MNSIGQLLQLIYISTATQKLSPADLNKILAEARPANQAKNITGMLLYRDGLFIQVLEGDVDAIKQLLINIKNDTRHRNVHIVSEEKIAKREFSEWTMGFKNISDDIDGANHFLESGGHNMDSAMKSSAAKKLLATFRDMR